MVIQGSLVAVAGILLFVPPADLPDPYVLSSGLTLLLAWSIASWRISGLRLFDPYCIFLISAFLFNAGHGLLEVIKSNEAGIMNSMFSESIVRETLVISFAGLASLHFGALLMLAIGSGRVGQLRWASTEREIWMRRIGWIQLFIAVPASIIWVWQAIGVVAATGYASLYDRDLGAGIAATPFLLSGLLVPGALFLTASGRVTSSTAALPGRSSCCSRSCSSTSATAAPPRCR